MLKDLFPFDWQAFHFLRPHFLWLFIPLGLLIVLGLVGMRQEIKWKRAIAPHLRPYVIRKGNQHLKHWMQLALTTIFSLGILALSGPAWKQKEVPGQQLETPMVLMLDLSQSMMAEDIQPNRLERAKFKIKDLLKHDPGARTALIGYAGTAHTIVPLTKDYDIILNHLDGLKPSIMPFSGSDMQAGFALLDTVLSVTKAPGTVLVFTDDFSSTEFEIIRNYTQNTNNKVIIVPFNTAGGSKIPSPSGRGSLKTKDGKAAYSSLNKESLGQLNSLENVDVQELTLDDSDVELISKKIRAHLEFTDKPEEKKDDWQDAGFILLIPMVIMLLLWFRKGWVLYSLGFILLTSCNQNTKFADLWMTKDYQAQRLADKGQFEKAAETFNDPLQKGVAWFKAGNYNEAIKAFNQDTTAMGAYNLGLAYLKSGDTLSAKLAFGMAVDIDSSFTQAQNNINQLEQLMPGQSEANPEDVSEAPPQGQAENTQNTSSEDLGGGGQEATEKEMQKERLEETVATDMRKGKELDEVPDDIGASTQQQSSKVLMRKVDDDPSLFLKRKFEFQVKKHHIKPRTNENQW